ncbi:MAG: rod shape-determining protein MreD [Candidatus Niyogibacteria bacterium]|nr:rod shape-determining protein MreD [Candidatus Niyogibacteria bacterium]
MAWFAVPVLPWPVLFGALVFAVASWEWFFEAALLGLIFDAVSGLPLGSYALLFLALVILTEGVKSYLRSDARLETISIAAIAAVLFGVLELIFWGVLYGRAALFSGAFYRDLAADGLVLALAVSVLVGLRILLRQIHPVKSGRNLTG